MSMAGKLGQNNTPRTALLKAAKAVVENTVRGGGDLSALLDELGRAAQAAEAADRGVNLRNLLADDPDLALTIIARLVIKLGGRVVLQPDMRGMTCNLVSRRDSAIEFEAAFEK